MQTEFKLKTEEIDNLIDFDIDPVECKIALKSEPFFELLQEIDNNGPEFIDIRVDCGTYPEKVMVLSGLATSGYMGVQHYMHHNFFVIKIGQLIISFFCIPTFNIGDDP